MMSPLLLNINIDGVVREVNVRVIGKWLEMLSAYSGWFEINQLLFADNTTLYYMVNGDTLKRVICMETMHANYATIQN